jgi:hypothetical protein
LGRVAGQRVRVMQSLSEVGGAHLTPTKTYASRTVILPASVAERLGDYLGRCAGHGPDAPVFTAPEGGWLNSRNFRQRLWMPALQAGGLPRPAHTCAALMM